MFFAYVCFVCFRSSGTAKNAVVFGDSDLQVTKPSSGFLGFHLNPFCFWFFFFFFGLKNKNIWIYCYSLWYVLDLSEAKNAVVFLQSFELRQKNKTFCVFRSGFDCISHPVA